MARDSQAFDPKKFINDIHKVIGNFDQIAFTLAYNFASNIRDQRKLNQCLKDIRTLSRGLPQENVQMIVLRSLAVYYDFNRPKYIKSVETHINRHLRKKRDSYLKKINRAIETLKALDPDPSSFDEGYLLNRAIDEAEILSRNILPLETASVSEPKLKICL